jgi:hypothetical protein
MDVVQGKLWLTNSNAKLSTEPFTLFTLSTLPVSANHAFIPEDEARIKVYRGVFPID